MDSIIIDLEFTNVYKNKAKRWTHYEVIQIGAVRLNDEMEIIDTFNSYVKPKYTVGNRRVRELTGISNPMLKEEQCFEEVFLQFLDWIGGKSYKLYSWGDADIRVILGEINLHIVMDERLRGLVMNWNDLQAEVAKLSGVTQGLSLDNVLNVFDITFEGKRHDAFDDAYNTSKIYKYMQMNKDLTARISLINDFYGEKKTFSYSMATMLEEYKKTACI